MQLHEIVRKIFIDAGINGMDIYDSSRYINLAENKEIDIQRFFISEFLRVQLCVVDEDTVDQRLSITSDQSLDQWLKRLSEDIAPFFSERGFLVDRKSVV